MARRPPSPALFGRQREQRVLDELLEAAKQQRSQSLVLVGGVGVGKSSLLAHVAEKADGCRVLRAAGVESEMALSFAGLQQLCEPLLVHLDVLPEPQRRSLETAFGRANGSTDPFMLGLAVLNLFAEESTRQPLVCLIDDVQWLDQESLQALRFVARRLLAEAVLLIFASRTDDPEQLREVASLAVTGLGRTDAAALLDSAILGVLDRRVRDRILAEARGNPLALLELPRVASPTGLGGGYEIPRIRTIVERVEESFQHRVAELAPPARQFLTTAAAEPTGDVAVLWRAAALQSISERAAELAEASGLVTLDTHVRFRHPLVRSSVYQAASPAARRAAHRALALATDDLDVDRQAWHRAHAAARQDEGQAAELATLAARAKARGGLAASAAFLGRAVELTPDSRIRGERALEAAQAEYDAGAHDLAVERLAIAEACPIDDLTRARLLLLRARIEFALRRGSEAPPMFLTAAERLEMHDEELAQDAYLEAVGAAIFVGRLGGENGVRSAAEASQGSASRFGGDAPTHMLLEALIARWVNGYTAGVGPMRRAIEGFRRQAADGHHDLLPWLWLACPVLPGPFGPELWDDQVWLEMSSLAVQMARGSGALAVLPVSLMYRAGVSIHMGSFGEARSLLDEAEAISSATGFAPGQYAELLLVAWIGRETEAVRMIEDCRRDATARGEGRVLGLAANAAAVLYNGLGRYERALVEAREAVRYDDMGFYGWSLSELVEAGARAESEDEAAVAMGLLDEITQAAGTDWALGMRARSLALLKRDTDAEALYREGIERLARTTMLVHSARAHLVYGEWLRREQRRIDARKQLRIAFTMFSEMGAEAFADRARRELAATGENVESRSGVSTGGLTAQEKHVAQLAAQGHTNPEIGAQLFISPRTVEYHMGKVLRKLDIESRRALRDVLTD